MRQTAVSLRLTSQVLANAFTKNKRSAISWEYVRIKIYLITAMDMNRSQFNFDA